MKVKLEKLNDSNKNVRSLLSKEVVKKHGNMVAYAMLTNEPLNKEEFGFKGNDKPLYNYVVNEEGLYDIGFYFIFDESDDIDTPLMRTYVSRQIDGQGFKSTISQIKNGHSSTVRTLANNHKTFEVYFISIDKIKFLFDVKDTFMGRMKRIKFDMYDNFKEINYMIGQKYKFKIQK